MNDRRPRDHDIEMKLCRLHDVSRDSCYQRLRLTLSLGRAGLSDLGSRPGISLVVGDRFQDLGQQVGLRLVADELEVLRPVGVVEDDGAEAVSLEQQELDLAAG